MQVNRIMCTYIYLSRGGLYRAKKGHGFKSFKGVSYLKQLGTLNILYLIFKNRTKIE